MLQPKKELDFFTMLPSGGFLLVPNRLMSIFDSYRQLNSMDLEAGGVLIGSWRGAWASSRQGHIELTQCSQPCMNDLRSRDGFERRCKHHLNTAEMAWHQSNGLESYLGEWHTHPEGDPIPSSEDMRQWRKNLRGKESVVIIVGIYALWVGFWDGKNAISLPKLKEDSHNISN